ncbi:MAG: hypothetical protein K2O54_06065, partial [Prevotella sp.]|nr:hypothetical protein [Prevotella sp.]
MEEENKGISIGDIFRVIFSQKWLALIIAVAITLLGTLAVYLGYGPSKTEYVSTFSVNLSVNDEGLLVYPSGATRNYRDFVSKANLQNVKESDEAFADVDADKIYKAGAISITQNRTETDGITYTIRAKAKYFPSFEVATEYISHIASTPSRQILEWAKNLSKVTKSSFEDKVGTEQKLSYLSTQLEEIGKRFEELGGMPATATERVKNLQETVTTLTGELQQYHYESDIQVLENYVYTIKALEKQLEPIQAAYNDIMDIIDGKKEVNGLTISITDSTITSYSQKVASLTQQIKEYNEYLDACVEKDESFEDGYKRDDNGKLVVKEETAASKAFTQKLEGLLADVMALTDTYESGYYENTSLVSYDGAQ